MSRKSIPKKIRDSVKSKYDYRCAYCGCKPDKLCIDHLKPVASGGTDDEENLLPACYQCNNYKMTFNLEFFRSMIADQVSMARRYSVNFRFAEKYELIKEIKKPIKFYFESKAAV